MCNKIESSENLSEKLWILNESNNFKNITIIYGVK